MHKLISVSELVERLGRKERDLKNAGAYAEAAGIRDSIVAALRLADEDEAPIEPSDEP